MRGCFNTAQNNVSFALEKSTCCIFQTETPEDPCFSTFFLIQRFLRCSCHLLQAFLRITTFFTQKIQCFLIFHWYLHHVLSAFKLNFIGNVLKHELERIDCQLVSLTDKKLAAIRELLVLWMTSFCKHFQMDVLQFQWKKLYVTCCHL